MSDLKPCDCGDRRQQPSTIMLCRTRSSLAASAPREHHMFMEDAYNAAICFKMLRDLNNSDPVRLKYIIKKIKSMAHCSPNLVLETIHDYFTDNPKISTRHKFRLFHVLESVIEASDSLEDIWEKTFMQLALDNMTKSTELEETYQDAAGNVLVAICRHSWQRVVGHLEAQVLTGIFPHRSLLYVLGILSSVDELFNREEKTYWEEQLMKMADSSVQFLQMEDWSRELLGALTKPHHTHQEQPPEKIFLFIYYGLILQAEQKSSTVRSHLQRLLETSHQWARQREGMALTVGLASVRHLDHVWAVLEQFGRSKPIKWCLHGFPMKSSEELHWKWASCTILLSYGQMAAKAKAHILPWVDNILSRMIFYFHYSAWDDTLKQSFLSSIIMLVGAISRNEGAQSYEFTQLPALLDCLAVLIEKEPPDFLCTANRQQALHIISSLCAFRPSLGADRKSRLLSTCLQSVLALPLPDVLEKHLCLFLEPPNIQSLYKDTMNALDKMLQSFILQNPTTEELHFLLSHLYIWLASEKVHERQRAVLHCLALLEFLSRNLFLDPKEDFKRMGQLVGMLGILCQDPDRTTRTSSLEGMGHLYKLLLHQRGGSLRRPRAQGSQAQEGLPHLEPRARDPQPAPPQGPAHRSASPQSPALPPVPPTHWSRPGLRSPRSLAPGPVVPVRPASKEEPQDSLVSRKEDLVWSGGDQSKATPSPQHAAPSKALSLFQISGSQAIKVKALRIQEVTKHLTMAELSDLIWTAIEGLGATSPFHVQAAAEMLLTVTQEHGATLKTVASLGRAIHLQLCSVRIPKARDLGLQALTVLARSHTSELVTALLDFSLPLDSHASRSWRALGAEQPLSRRVLATLLDHLLDRALPATASTPAQKTYLRSLAAMVTLQELQFVREFRHAVREAFPRLFLALLTQIRFVLELDLQEAPPHPEGPNHHAPPTGLTPPSPHSTALEALKSLLSTTGHWRDFAQLELQGAWTLLTKLHSYPQGVGLLARAMVQDHCDQIRAVLWQLLPALSSWEQREREVAVLILGEFLYSPALLDVLSKQDALTLLSQSLQDPSPEVRVWGLQGLGHILFHPEKESLLRSQLPHFLGGLCQNSESAVVCVMGTMSSLLRCLGGHGAGPLSLEVAIHACSFFDHEWDEIRAAAMALFGDLVAATASGELASLQAQVCQSLVPLLLHLKDPSPAVATQAKFTFYRCALCLRLPLPHTLFCVLAWGQGPSALHFLWTYLVRRARGDFSVHTAQALGALHSCQGHIRTWAALFLGYAICYHPQAMSQLLNNEATNLLLHTFEELESHEEPGIRTFARGQLAFLQKTAGPWQR
ncbi:maestro heat-like repeat family member 5 [Sorex araneus]|uniref:maestro heat-like repeat family member 5 n=1 Tax=Sorex araneus TaxID=42254 RepID=UPI002433FFCF|nr:maestro heat-like repeat family member 5 [Sorex araneus]